MAAEILAKARFAVTLYDRMPSLGRKFLMAGRGGLNLTHSEALDSFIQRYGPQAKKLSPLIHKFSPADLRAWCEGLGQETFVGSSGRVFPRALKASPLLRAWITRLESLGVEFKLQRRWTGWDTHGQLTFIDAAGHAETARADATLLALGGASWPKLGSDGAWVNILGSTTLIEPLRPANCGFNVKWSEIFRTRYAGQPVKPVTLSLHGKSIPGEIMITDKGVEGGAIYALSSAIRDDVLAQGSALINIDLRPGLDRATLTARLTGSRQRQSFSNYLRKSAGMSAVAAGLIVEHSVGKDPGLSPAALTGLIKSFPLKLEAPFPIERAISSAGGLSWAGLDNNFMLKNHPGVFAAGEMMDWEAPTGGYLLQATFCTAHHAAEGIVRWLNEAAISSKSKPSPQQEP